MTKHTQHRNLWQSFFFWNPTRQATTRSEQPNCLYEHNETYYLATWYVMANTNEDEKYDCFSAKSLKKRSQIQRCQNDQLHSVKLILWLM